MKHNSYFEGKVQSLALGEREGPATVGVIEPGKYSFSTSSQELMTVTVGSMKVRLPGAEWRLYVAGETFAVSHGVTFDVDAGEDVAYVCRYR